MTVKPMGRCYGVGLGPGDPELLTRKAERILTEVDWIYLPAEASRSSSFATGILAPLGLPAQKFRRLTLHMSREPGANRAGYRQTAAEILVELRLGKSVAWATEGDPLLYSTFLHLRKELLALAPDVAVEVIPGVTSMQAAAARIGKPVAWRDEKLAIVPAAYGIEHLADLLGQFATVFLIKVYKVFDQLVDVLEKVETSLEASYLEHVGTPQERVVTDLKSLVGLPLPYFSLVIVRRRDAGGN